MTPREALQAIRARIDGVYDDPQLMRIGALSIDPEEDIRTILDMVIEEEE